MAKRPAEDDEDEAPKVRKRRRPKKLPDDDEEGAGKPAAKGRPADDDDDEEEGNSLSTGNIFLDIALDFRDDCLDWAKDHFFYTVIISVTAFIIFAVVSSLTVHSWVRYLIRPTLTSVLKTYDIGAYGEAKLAADEALRYTGANDMITRAGLAFVQGAANVAVGDSVAEIDKHIYYLTAANYLKESQRYGFVEGRVSEGFFLLGKALYFCNDLTECRKPLEASLDKETPHRKMALWYLANAYCFGAYSDMKLAQSYLQSFQNDVTVIEEQLVESYLLTAMIEVQNGNLEAAEKAFAKVPHFQQLSQMRHYVEGLIDFAYARQLRQQAEKIENNPNPVALEQLPAAPAPVKSERSEEEPPFEKTPDKNSEKPTAPAPVTKIQEDKLGINTKNLKINSSVLKADTSETLPVFGFDSAYSKRLAELQPKYGESASGGKVIVLPQNEEPQAAPLPPEMKTEGKKELPAAVNPLEERIREFYNAAAERYKNAVGHFTTVLQQASHQSHLLRSAGLLAGICSDELNSFQAKIKTGGEMTHQGSDFFIGLTESYPHSPETAAASFLIGQKDRKLGKTEMSYRAFAGTFSILRKMPGYSNAWVPKDVIIGTLLEYIRSSIERLDYDDAVTLLKMVKGVMPDTEETRLRGEMYEGWASMLQSHSETVFGSAGNQLIKEAAEKRRLAGKAFDEYAATVAGSPPYSDILWRSAENYREGNDYRNAALQYRRFAKADHSEHRPELYLYLGETYLNLDAVSESASVLEDALKDYPADHLTPMMRLVLSRSYQELAELETEQPKRGYSDEAKGLLKQNLSGEFTPESAIYRNSIYALGQLCYQRNELDEASAHLEDAVNIHPDALQAADGYYTLALCRQKQADNLLSKLDDLSTELMQNTVNAAVSEKRQQALTHLKSVITLLSQRARGIGLTTAEKLMLRNAQFAVGTLMMKMNQFQESVPVWKQTAMYYQNQPEALDALVSLAYALRKSGRKEDAVSILNRADVLLNQLVQSGSIAESEQWKNLIEQEKRRD
jgi:TolA-binding protein